MQEKKEKKKIKTLPGFWFAVGALCWIFFFFLKKEKSPRFLIGAEVSLTVSLSLSAECEHFIQDFSHVPGHFNHRGDDEHDHQVALRHHKHKKINQTIQEKCKKPRNWGKVEGDEARTG